MWNYQVQAYPCENSTFSDSDIIKLLYGYHWKWKLKIKFTFQIGTLLLMSESNAEIAEKNAVSNKTN